tara:strand:+ start:47 stop:667 length:621 start_codon:yes stop_codon:yes gene_type:complete
MATKEKSVFETLSVIDVGEHTEKKGQFTYLSWAWAWHTTMALYPDMTTTVYENQDGWNYHHDGKTAWVKTGVTISGVERIEFLPVMNHLNKSITLEAITSTAVNTSIQRSLTKAMARHGLGFYIFQGEDMPETPVWDNEKQRDAIVEDVKALIDDKQIEEAIIMLSKGKRHADKVVVSKRKASLWSGIGKENQIILHKYDKEKEVA